MLLDYGDSIFGAGAGQGIAFLYEWRVFGSAEVFVTPVSRIFLVAAEDRGLIVAAENREFSV